MFGEIADLLELGDEIPTASLPTATRNAGLRSTGYDIPALLAAGEGLQGCRASAELGEDPRDPRHGTSKALEKLRRDYPPGILDLLRLPGVGPKRVRLFYRELGVGSLEELERAVRSGRLRSLGGFGAKSEQRLLEAILTVKSRNAKRL